LFSRGEVIEIFSSLGRSPVFFENRTRMDVMAKEVVKN
jgi:hypothetical protein